MRRIVAGSAFFILTLPLTLSAQSIEGVWKAAEVVIGGGTDEGRHTTDLQPGLYFFSESHYSTMFVRGWEPRPMLSDNPTSEERGRVYGPFTANAGTYELEGSTLTYTPIVAKNPATMTNNSYTAEVEWAGDALWLTFDAFGVEWKNRVRYVRVED